MGTPQQYDHTRAVGKIDRMLLRGASSGKSPTELSSIVGNTLTPAAAAARVLEILDSRDWLSQAQRKLLLIDDLMDLKDRLMKIAESGNTLDAATPLRQVLQTILKVLETDKVDIARAMREINRSQARLMLEAIMLMYERVGLELSKRHPEIDFSAEMAEILPVAMPHAVKMIEGRVPVETPL
ncbi:hypothetical protein [Agromyces sp. NPDC058104]|uniref:hypothetical protein n=1 Tax=Agromyces sp. NPDC058104 TaxID=3346342 RepID=UPI0036DC8C11